VRGILDGHIVLDRGLASRGHYPAIDFLPSISRVMNEIVSPEHIRAATRLKKLLAVYRNSEDLINIGAYQAGSNAEIDEAIRYYGTILDFLQQRVDEKVSFEEASEQLIKLFGDG